ncbi:unnamed protein product [Mesocestoides corti]|uniref:C2 domain-containing protein n=1 Tax=Mesocestoides corti TaxID=53468 RepID=A0A158QUH2_MESCO|nr:unnamed protein product [Mesocestoides corti]
MLQTLRSRVVDGWRSLPIPRAGQGESGTRPPLLRQPTVDDASSREPLSPPTWSPPVKYQPSEFVKSRELGRLDPNLYLNETNEDLYDVPLDHLGRVWFTISYDETAEQLRITIHKARNLRAPHHQSLRSSGSIAPSEITTLSLLTPTPTQDCRIRVYIQRSEKKFHATSIKKQTNNPTFEESFTFQLPKHELSNQSIRLDVLSIEKTKRTLLIGYVSFPLAVINQTGSQWRPMRVARDLQLCDSSNVNLVPGNILLVVALTYFPSADRLTVGLFECHNLPLKASGLPISASILPYPTDCHFISFITVTQDIMNEESNQRYLTCFPLGVYAKVMLSQGIQSKLLKTKRTELLDQRESFNESFTFSKLGDPSNIHIRIVLTQPGFIDKPVAIVVLGNEMVSKGNGISHWASVMEHPELTVTECHELQPL